MNHRENTKYGHLAKEILYEKNVGTYDQYTVLDQSFFGWDNVSLREGLVGKPGMILEETDKQHTHDYAQVLWFLSSDPHDLLELGADIEMTLGEECTRFHVDTPCAVCIPAGMPHFSPVVLRMDRKFFFMSANVTGELAATVADPNAVHDSGVWGEFRSPYKKYIKYLKFARKGPHHYGSALDTDSGGVFTRMDLSSTDIPIGLTWQTVTKAHDLGPRNEEMQYKPHVHTFNESLIFLSMDQDDLTDIHAKASFCFGEEGKDQETFLVDHAAAMVMPAGNYHLPLKFLSVEKPMIFISLSSQDPAAPGPKKG